MKNYILKLQTFLKENNYSTISLKKIKTNHIQVKAEVNDVKGIFIVGCGH